ncbi:MAG: L,D-transpeptidase [Gammaproteobacteria bacterium]|nr:MAG: L,D-transpeptidase [Gammaproteobacteria bacterium]
MMKVILTTLLIFTAMIGLTPVLASENIELVIDRSEHKLIVKKNGSTLRTFKVALGSGGRKAKLQQGDHKTPKGNYQITKIRDSSRFHMFLQINYPNMNDAGRALKNHVITRKQYQDILDAHSYGRLPPQNTALGGSIGIHGIGHETKDKIEIHQIADWTQGCIALRNDEVEELSRFIHVGTTVSIID